MSRKRSRSTSGAARMTWSNLTFPRVCVSAAMRWSAHSRPLLLMRCAMRQARRRIVETASRDEINQEIGDMPLARLYAGLVGGIFDLIWRAAGRG